MTNPLTAPTVTEGLFDTAAVIAWLRSIEAVDDLPIVPGAIGRAIPDGPDRLAVVTLTSGGPERMQGLEDNRAFQLRIRGAQGDPWDAERLAITADRRIRFAALPATVAGIRVFSVWRTGSGPAVLQPAPTSGLRAEFVCTYGCSVSTF